MKAEVIAATESVCPECLKRIPAQRIIEGDKVYLVKNCPEHGDFRALIWQGEPYYKSWGSKKIPSVPQVCATKVDKGCPYDCGLCPEHRQHPCCVLLEITRRCNLHCPICFADSTQKLDHDPDLSVIESWYRMLLASGGPYNIQLSGGEPTMRDDLPEMIRLGHNLGFPFIQINTNGVRLAREPQLVQELKDVGLNCVFLQFDGLSDKIYEATRGAPLLKTKLRAIEQCAKYGIGVVLVPTLVPGINTNEIGKMICFAMDHMPGVRGVHFQPISYFGRYPSAPPNDRITIPQIISEIERQTDGKLKVENFLPPGGENSYCSFHGNFILMPDGVLHPWASRQNQCCTTPTEAAKGAISARKFVAKQWSAPKCCNNEATVVEKRNHDMKNEINTDSMDVFLSRVATHTLSISGMAFQDAWTLDLDRLRDCLIHVVSPDNKLIPFCAYNLTAKDGRSIYRNQR